MSRDSQAKKARRRKRRAARDAAWLPEPVFEQTMADEDRLDAIDVAIAQVDDWLAPKGWTLDPTTDTPGLVSWVYPPSAAQFDDPDLEPVTRLWFALAEGEDEVVLEFGSVLVGFGLDDDPLVLSPDKLAEDVDALEGYRPGLPRPVLG